MNKLNIQISITVEPEDAEALCQELANKISPLLAPSVDMALMGCGEDDLVSLDAATKLLGVDKTTLYRWRKSGYIKSVKRGRKVYFRKDELVNNKY